MADDDGTAPVAAWRKLAHDEDPDDALEVAELLDIAPSKHLGSLVGSVVERAIGVLLLGGPPDVEARLLAYLRTAAPRAAEDASALPVDGQGLVAASTLLTCLPGGSPIAQPDVLARRWAPGAAATVDELDDEARNDWALVCAAHGLDELVERFLSGPPPVLHPVRLAREVVAASGDSAAVRRDWETFVAAFPAAYAVESVRLSSLLQAGWAVHVRLGGGRPEQVFAALGAATGLRLL